MAKRLNLTLPDTLDRFVAMNSGDGTEFVNGPDYVRHCLREKRQRMIAEDTDASYHFHIAALESLEQAIEGGQGRTIDEMEEQLLSDL